LFVKNYPFKLLRKLSNFNNVLRRFDTAQDLQHSVVGSANGNLHSLIFLDFGPSCSNSFPCALTSLRWCEFSGPGRTAFFAAISPQSDGGGIFLPFVAAMTVLYVSARDLATRERSGIEDASGEPIAQDIRHGPPT
jgi:hypothetical protein